MKDGAMPHHGPYSHISATKEERRRSRPALTRLLRFVLSGYKGWLFAVALCVIVTSVTTLLSTLFTKTLIDSYITPLMRNSAGGESWEPLSRALTRLGAVLLVGVVCSYAYNLIMISVTQGTMLRIRQALFQHMERLPVSFFDRRARGDVMSIYTNDVDTLRQMIGQSLPQLFNSVITLAVTFAGMLSLSLPLTLVSAVVAALMAIATNETGKRSRIYFRRQQESIAGVNAFVEEMITGQKVVKMFCREKETVNDFSSINERLRDSACRAGAVANMVMPVNGNLGNLGYVLLAVVGAWLALAYSPLGAIGAPVTLGTVVAFLTLNKNFTRPVSQISQQMNSIVMAAAGAERLFALIDEKTEEMTPAATPSAAAEKEGAAAITFSHVTFGYVEGKDVLHDISFEALPDRKTAFVGSTGAGKTTIMNLVTRFYDVEDGRIEINGANINTIPLYRLRRAFGLVPQDTRLFTASVIDNIRYGRLEATDDECRRAAALVGADSFIRRLASGYDTMLSGDGGNLSQGEGQLIAVARAAVADTPMLILDEATSSVDTRTEQIVQQGMDRMMKGRTTFVIAHRLSTVRNADNIIVMEEGRIIEQGNHDALMARHGLYYRLYTGHDIT